MLQTHQTDLELDYLGQVIISTHWLLAKKESFLNQVLHLYFNSALIN